MAARFKGAHIHKILIYDNLPCTKNHAMHGVGDIGFSRGTTCDRVLSLNLRGSGGSAIRVRKVWAEVVEVLKANGYAVGRRERDV